MSISGIISTLVSVFALGLLIALHELGHFSAARRMGMKVLRYSIGLMHPIFSWTSKRSEITYQVGMVPFGGFVQIKGMNPYEPGAYIDQDSFQYKSALRRLFVIVAGPIANLIVAWIILFVLFTFGLPETIDKPVIGKVFEDRPAASAGLQSGDRVTRVNQKEVTTWGELAAAINAHPGQEITLEYFRGEAPLSLSVTPEDAGGTGIIGITPATEIVSLPVHMAAVAAAERCGTIVYGTLKGLGQLVTGTAQNMQAVGPVGIVKMASSTLQTGLREFFSLMVYLSLMLFIFNLLPLPALDGGRAFGLLFEIVTRKRVNKKLEAITNTVGFFVLLAMILGITIKELFWG